MSHAWRITGATPPQDFTEIRVQLHYAVQFLAVVGAVLAGPQPDRNHAGFDWNPDLDLFVSPFIPCTGSVLRGPGSNQLGLADAGRSQPQMGGFFLGPTPHG